MYVREGNGLKARVDRSEGLVSDEGDGRAREAAREVNLAGCGGKLGALEVLAQRRGGAFFRGSQFDGGRDEGLGAAARDGDGGRGSGGGCVGCGLGLVGVGREGAGLDGGEDGHGGNMDKRGRKGGGDGGGSRWGRTKRKQGLCGLYSGPLRMTAGHLCATRESLSKPERPPRPYCPCGCALEGPC